MGLEKRLLHFLHCFTILFLRISPEWLTRITSNVADGLYDIYSTCTNFASTIYDGFRIPWTINHLEQAETYSCFFAYFHDYPSYNTLRIIFVTDEACKRNLNCPSGQVFQYPTIRPDTSRQIRHQFSTFLCTGKAKKWKHRTSHQSSQSCAVFLVFLLGTTA